jgi:hypothetical protein
VASAAASSPSFFFFIINVVFFVFDVVIIIIVVVGGERRRVSVPAGGWIAKHVDGAAVRGSNRVVLAMMVMMDPIDSPLRIIFAVPIFHHHIHVHHHVWWRKVRRNCRRLSSLKGRGRILLMSPQQHRGLHPHRLLLLSSAIITMDGGGVVRTAKVKEVVRRVRHGDGPDPPLGSQIVQQ